jgi:uncharacterized protein YndB with AHSA1/START domain
MSSEPGGSGSGSGSGSGTAVLDPTRRLATDSTVVAAPPAEVFDLLADPRRHAEFDGSGTVQGAMSGPSRLALGTKFGMRMRIGLPYLIRNVVVEFEENRRIAWRHFGRHVWRYELEPVDGGTRVTETFDYAHALSPRVLELTGAPRANLRGISATLERLRTHFARS